MRSLGEDKSPEGVSRVENIEELLNSVKDFSEGEKEVEDGSPLMENFMKDIALLTDRDKDDPKDTNKVSLMTIHLAKGLEFPVVFIVGLEENLFPSMMTVNSRADLEEERRLFYVALTRAENQAFLSYAQMRYRWGKLIDCEPSRFIEEIDEKYLDINIPEFSPFLSSDEMRGFKQGSAGNDSSNSGNTPTGSRSPRAQRSTSSSTPATGRTPQRNSQRAVPSNLKRINPTAQENISGNFSALTDLKSGERIKHPRFGHGIVKVLEGEADNKKAVIAFDNVGEKKLLLKFAKLERVGA
jgi:DNA helicase-2/ATP-dependent DNA helicase PcrA